MPAAPPLYRHSRVESTLDTLHELAEAGAVEGTAVVALEQTAGRGRRGHTWHSPTGGLWLSWLCRPKTPLAAEVLSLRVGLVMAGVLDQLGDVPPVQVKWPNDVLIGGRKAAGILCEARWQGGALAWIAVGIGLNVTNPLPADIAGNATRIAEYCSDTTPDSILAVLLQELESVPGRPPALSAAELAAFAERDFLIGRRLREPLPGIARGITPEGALRVEEQNGQMAEVRAGSVELA
jgi:BirA family biotin operon repressor/biotin-[acetyl-CoA-carboxylase] ligase